MPNYFYKAIDNAGKPQSGTFVAFSEDDVEQRLGQKGLTLIKCKETKGSVRFGIVKEDKVKPRILAEFYNRLSQTLEMGLSLITALDENAKMLPSKSLKKVLEELRAGLEGGSTLYEAMSRFPHVFQPLDLAIIRMGEQSEVLPKSIKDLALFLEWKEDIRSIMKRAAIYPSFIILILTAVIGVWVGYVLPQMAVMLKEMGVVLPGLTQTVFSLSNFIQANWSWIIGGAVFIGILLHLCTKTDKGKILLHRYLLKMPVIGAISMNLAVARLSRNFATMFSAGMTINNIFEILSNNVIGNRYLEGQLTKAYSGIQRGQTIANAFDNAGGFPPLLVGGIKTGETTGTLGDAFSRLGDYYDGEVKRAVQTMISAIEPITIMLLGGVFGLIVLSIMLPLYDVVGSLGKAY